MILLYMEFKTGDLRGYVYHFVTTSDIVIINGMVSGVQHIPSANRLLQ